MAQSGGRQRNPARAVTWPPSATAGALASNAPWTLPFDWLRAWAQAEAGPGRLLPWVPVAFGAGIALYFAAEREPVAWVTAAAAGILASVAVLLRRSSAFPSLLLVAAIAAGFATATWKSTRIAHEVLARPIFGAALTGFVETREERERSDRFVLRVATMETLRDTIKLTRVRLSVKKGTAPEVGSFIALKARLQPPLAPLRPGGYDFARDLYFQGIGASGFVTGTIKKVDPPTPPSRHLQYAATMQGMRDAIDARIRATLTGDNRAIATALLTGRRDAISSDVNDAMFISGLGHVLSISGYHMAVVAGVVFSPGCKLMLLTLANYADDTGCCWPSQETLSHDTEQSLDSVQRYLKKLEKLGLIRKIIRPQGPGRWASRTYFLNLTVAEMSKPQSAAQSDDGLERDASATLADETMPHGARDHAANTSVTMPHQTRDHAARVRHEPSLDPSLNPSLEPSATTETETVTNRHVVTPKLSAFERQKAFQGSRSPVEVIQNRIAQKIGSNGWEVLQGLSDTDLQRITRLEERGRLDAAAVDLLRRGKSPKELA